MKTIKKGALEYLMAENIPIPHCFTTRLGGVSTGYFSSMNIAIKDGESEDNVRRNLQILAQELDFPLEGLVLTRQTHSDIVRVVTKGDCRGCFHREYPICDALVTNDPGVTLAVFTADCTPILFYDPVTGAVGAAHAGWRGTASAIAARTVEAMAREFGSRPEDLCCAVGPNIGFCCFETDADVPEAMIAAFGSEVQAYIRPSGDKYYVNLKEINALVLRRAGVRHIDISCDCTKCQPQRFWSHRITGQLRGSQGAIIPCKEESI